MWAASYGRAAAMYGQVSMVKSQSKCCCFIDTSHYGYGDVTKVYIHAELWSVTPPNLLVM